MCLSLEEFYHSLKRNPYTTYIVVLQYKYKHESIYTLSNEILDTTKEIGTYKWLHDWDEGYDDIRVIGYKGLDSLDITNAIVEEEII